MHSRLTAKELGLDAAADLSQARIEEKIRVIREALVAAGRTVGDVEIQFTVYVTEVDGKAPSRSTLVRHLRADPDSAANSRPS